MGLNLDFVVLNLTKHSSYLIYNASLFFSSTVQRQYREKFGFDEVMILELRLIVFKNQFFFLLVNGLFGFRFGVVDCR